MVIKAILVVALLVALSSVVYSAGTFEQVTHYQYVTEWTPTYCRYPPTGSVCLSGLLDIFVMHGIWPTNSTGGSVEPCKSVSLSYDLMKRFEENLSRLWPCIMKGSPFAFWGHEYSRHGSCLQGWNGLQFISFATLVSGNNNMTKILQNNGVVTSKVARYSKNQIKQAIQTKIGRGLNVYLSCKVITPSLYYLREVTVCIRKIADPRLLNYQFQSCPDYANRDNCGGNNPGGNTIMLPPS